MKCPKRGLPNFTFGRSSDFTIFAGVESNQSSTALLLLGQKLEQHIFLRRRSTEVIFVMPPLQPLSTASWGSITVPGITKYAVRVLI
eukprot:scaffold19873_cov92-Skeletonema_marinoi.AAC.1